VTGRYDASFEEPIGDPQGEYVQSVVRGTAEDPWREAWQETSHFGQPLDLQNLGLRLVAGTTGVLIICLTTLWWGRHEFGRVPSQSINHADIRILGSLAMTSLQWIRIGNREIVVGQDAGGIKSMVLLPEPFTRLMEEFDDDQGADLRESDAPSRRKTRLNRSDQWAANRPIS
jgi:hypothetical protein